MDYKIIRTNRKTTSISVDDNLQIVVRAPYNADSNSIDAFVNSNENWIDKAVESKKRFLQRTSIDDEEIKKLVIMAKSVIPDRVEYYSSVMNLQPTNIKITRAKKRFGSCNSKNALCFSCFLMLYPIEAVDYVVVHELAHIKNHNHSKEFYKTVRKFMPDYKYREGLLKQ